MTLMPVSKTSIFVDCSTKVGGARWIGRAALRPDGGAVVDRVADDVEDATEALGPDRHRDGRAGVANGHPAHQAVGGVHGDRANGALAQVLRDLERQVVLRAGDAGVGDLQGVEDLRQLAVGELDVDDRADDLNYLAEARGGAVRGDGKRRLGHGARVYHGVRGSSIIDGASAARISLALARFPRASRTANVLVGLAARSRPCDGRRRDPRARRSRARVAAVAGAAWVGAPRGSARDGRGRGAGARGGAPPLRRGGNRNGQDARVPRARRAQRPQGRRSRRRRARSRSRSSSRTCRSSPKRSPRTASRCGHR